MKSNPIVAYCFTDLKGSVIESKLENTPMTPASNTKIITAYLSVKKYGLNHTFKTSFGILDNSIVVNGGPTFFFNPNSPDFLAKMESTFGQLSHNFNLLKSIVLSNPVVDSRRYNPCWQIGESKYSYQAPISNFFVNENCNQKEETDKKPLLSTVLDHENEDAYFPVKNPERHFGDSLLEPFSLGYNVPVKRVNVENPTVSAEHTAPLSEVVSHMLVESCNFYAEVLFKSLSYDGKNQGSWAKSVDIAANMLTDIDGAEGIRIKDGSGLCKDNLLTPLFTVNLLRTAYEKYGKGFTDLFPEPGEGTLRRRLLQYKDWGLIAKTGTLSSVSALSGYILKYGVIFSIFINNSLAQTRDREGFIDKIVSDFIGNNFKQ